MLKLHSSLCLYSQRAAGFQGVILKGVTRGDERADNYHPTPTQSSVWVESHRFHQLCFQAQQAATETFPPCKITRSTAEIDRTPCMHALNVMSEINVALCAQLKTTSLVSLCQTTLSFVHFLFFFLHQISGQAEFSLSRRNTLFKSAPMIKRHISYYNHQIQL